MDNSNRKKYEQLGMPLGTASGKLRKAIMFQLLQELGKDNCFQCGKVIESIDNLSIEHKVPWLDSNDPVAVFFDLNNIAFSHLKCNLSAMRPWNKGNLTHGTNGYKHGCRCTTCRIASNTYKNEYRRNGGVH